MDSYRPLFFSVAALVAWWTLASQSYPASPAFPQEWLRATILSIAIVYLLITGNNYRKEGHNISCMFICSAALIPPVYYIEQWYLTSQQAVDAQATQAGLIHAISVYNAFRYFLLLISFIILFKKFIHNFKSF